MLAFAGGDSRKEIPTAPTKNPKSETMTSTPDDAELLKDPRGLDKPPLFDENDTDMSPFPVSEDDSIILRHMDDMVDTNPDKCHRHRAFGEMANPRNQHIEIPQTQYTDKVADESVAVQRQISRRTTETKAPEHQQDDRSGGDADKDVQGEGITKYSWSEGKNAVNIYLELDGLDDVTEDAFKAENGKTKGSLTIASVAGKQRIFTLTGLAHEITGVKVAQKRGKQTVSLKLAKKEKKTWHKLLGEASTKEAVADDTAKSITSITSRSAERTANNRGVSSIRSFRSEQTQRRKRGGLEIQPFGDCWIEAARRRKYLEVTSDLRRELKKWNGALVVSGGVLDTEGMDEDGQDLFRHADTGRWRCTGGSMMSNGLRFRRVSKVCRDGDPVKREMPLGTREAIEQMWQQVLEDVEASKTRTRRT